MTSPRRQIVDPVESGFYHCISRCVRRAFLCGNDPVAQRSFEHRKAWVEDRLLELATIFAVGVYAYAVMSNQGRPGQPQFSSSPTRRRGAFVHAAALGGRKLAA